MNHVNRSFEEVMATLRDRMENRTNRQCENSKQTSKPGEDKYKCSKCRDAEWIIRRDETGADVAAPCECRKQKLLTNRFNASMIPSEFENARFDNYRQESEIQRTLFSSISGYLKIFAENFDKEKNKYTADKPNLGFIAEFGEQRIRQLDVSVRAQTKREKNSFGLGKTHLQVAAAKWLMHQGFTTLLVSDIEFMDELIQARMQNDQGEELNRLVGKALNVNVLIWDDIGKSKPSEAKESLYYKIINERYRHNRPILFSSNEDRGSLAERIGYAASSRLLGNCRENHFVEGCGEDWRLRKGEAHV